MAFGTDGTAHGGLDLFQKIRLFRSLMQVKYGIDSADSMVMLAETLLKTATVGGEPFSIYRRGRSSAIG